MCVRVYVEYASRARDIRTQLHQAACALISEIHIHSLLFPFSRDAYDKKSTGFYYILQNVDPDTDCCYLRDIPLSDFSRISSQSSLLTLFFLHRGESQAPIICGSLCSCYTIYSHAPG